jgi:Uma2 family endonuclease
MDILVPERFWPQHGTALDIGGPPERALEVLSPSDRASEVFGKLQDCLGAGCRNVWVVDPERPAEFALEFLETFPVEQPLTDGAGIS